MSGRQTLKFDPENGGQICVKLCIITRKVSRQIKNFFQRIETYSSSFRMLKEFECTSYFKPTSLHQRKSVFSFAEQLMIQPRSQGFSLFVIGKAGKGPGTGRSHDFQHPDIVGVINYNNNELENPRWPPT